MRVATVPEVKSEILKIISIHATHAGGDIH